jgi:hypothetical protein
MEQIDYKELYEQAKERAKHNLTYAQVEEIFPEPESEDERIRKWIVSELKGSLHNIEALYSRDYDNRDKDDIIREDCLRKALAWLEKQGKQESVVDTKVIIPKFRVGDIVKSKSQPMLSPRKIISIGKDCYWCEDRGCIGFAWEDDCEIVEQNPDDKVEPKFKTGDWVVYDHRAYQVVELPKEGYINLGLRRNGKIEFAPSTYCRHWTIQDAKDGDVLAYRGEQWIFIYKERKDETLIEYYALASEKGLTINDVALTVLLSCIVPATKEQREQLEKAMADAGYKWNPDEKKMEKIEQKPAEWHREDEQNLNACLGFIPDEYLRRWLTDVIRVKYDKSAWSEADEEIKKKVMHSLSLDGRISNTELTDIYNWLKSLKDRVQPKQEWSEEDENHVKSILSTIECCKAQFPNSQAVVEAYNADIEWLKSIRAQNTYKPSDRQLAAIATAIGDEKQKGSDVAKEL